ncbi:MAG: hypothetical protein ACK5TH_20560 [Prosthecobacter sp.]
MKWFIRILVVLAVLITGLLWFGYSKIDDLLKLGIEKAGTEALQVPVKLDKVSLSMFSGAGALEGLEIGTPAVLTAVILSKLSEEAAKAGAGGAVENLLKGGNIKVDTQELKQGVNELKKLFGK